MLTRLSPTLWGHSRTRRSFYWEKKRVGAYKSISSRNGKESTQKNHWESALTPKSWTKKSNLWGSFNGKIQL